MQRVNVIGLLAVIITAVVSVGAFIAWKMVWPAWADTAAQETSWFTLSDARVTGSQLYDVAQEQQKSVTNTENMLKKAPFTALYLADLPPETPNSEVLNKEKIEQFAEAHLGEALPALPEKAVLGTVSNDPESIKRYFAVVLPIPDGTLQPVGGADVSAVLRARQEGGAQLLPEVTKKVENNLGELQKTAVPSALLVLHTQYIQATTALLDGLRLLVTAQSDPVAGLIAQKQLERSGVIIQELNHRLHLASQADYAAANEPEVAGATTQCGFCLNIEELKEKL